MPPHHPERRLGILYVVLASFSWSLGGLFSRALSIDMWTVNMWRALVAVVVLGTVYGVVHRGHVVASIRAMPAMTYGLAVAGMIAMTGYVGALTHTTVANVTIIYATAPFIAAALAFLWLRERVAARTVIASAASLIGVLIMLAGSLGSGGVKGDLMAVGLTTSFAFVIVGMKRWPMVDMLPTTIISSILTVLISLPFIRPGVPTPGEFVFIIGFAMSSIVLGFFLFVAGARRLRAAEAGLIATLEIALGPLWVLLIFGERPTDAGLVGGVVVVAAIVWHLYGDLRRELSTPQA